ncbi:MAG TPA: hypothetical protein VIP08_09370 [Phenylobacterium sp.]|uniref:hypothetical protein n=1 Tax=Phenylobacterium sp. TaxID=1871053 RepID=UPI002F939539
MIARRKVAFLRLCALLRAIEADLDNFDAVRALNLGVLKEILNDERHIRRLRGLLKDLKRRLKTERPPKAEALALRKQIKRHEGAITRYEGQLFIWRCIADGLVYAYISTFNVKHAYFESDTFGVKPSAGFIGGKDGLGKELGMLLWAIEQRVPAVLSDITNIIRYGDVCLLGGPDPVPMEVKSRPELNRRGKRQTAKLNLLETFLKEDVAAGFRGMPEVRRVAYALPHRDCLADLNACIQNARRDGWNTVCPEKGLAYMATFTGKLPDGFLENLNMTYPIVFTPNGDKMDRAWAPYLPFTNSIRDLQDLYDFAAGNLYLVVAIDAAVVCDRLSIPDWKTSLIADLDRIILMEHLDSGAKIAISTQFFGRFGLEFMSLDWFVEHQTESVLGMWSEMMASQGPRVDVAEVGDWGAQMEAAPRLYQAKLD